MKKFLLPFTFLLTFFAAHSQTNIYHPFPDSNGVWNEYYQYSSPFAYGYYLESFFGDTIINSFKYHKVYQHTLNGLHSDTAISQSNSIFIGGIREDSSKRIYFYNKGGVIQSNVITDSIYLLYDFSKQIGDTIFFSNTQHYAYPYLVLDSIDSILVNNHYRKKYHLSVCSSCLSETWIEGIGSTRGLFSTIIQYPTCGCINEVVCYKYIDTVYYLNPLVTDCFTFGVVNINELEQHESIAISPNPFSTQTTLHSDKIFKDATLTVYNFFGQQIKEIKNILGQTIILQRDNLPSGLYFLRLMQNNQTIFTNKLVITD